MLSTFLPFYLLPLVSKFRGVFGGRKLFLPGHFGLIRQPESPTKIKAVEAAPPGWHLHVHLAPAALHVHLKLT